MRAQYVSGNPRVRNTTYKSTHMRSSTHRDNMRSISLVGALILVVAALGISLSLASAGSNLIQEAIGTLDRTASDTIIRSTPETEWQAGEMPYLYQTDKQWSEKSYGGGTIGDYGCGPTCLSMVYVALSGSRSMPPDAMAAFSSEHGFLEGGITSWTLMSEGAQLLKLRSEEVGASTTEVMNHLWSGHPIICSVGPGDFTTVGHFIVLWKANEDGTVEIRDPNSPSKSKQSWELDRILSQCSNLWAYSLL